MMTFREYCFTVYIISNMYVKHTESFMLCFESHGQIMGQWAPGHRHTVKKPIHSSYRGLRHPCWMNCKASTKDVATAPKLQYLCWRWREAVWILFKASCHIRYTLTLTDTILYKTHYAKCYNWKKDCDSQPVFLEEKSSASFIFFTEVL